MIVFGFGYQRRNKPKEAPKAPQAAPFFLQNLNGAAAAASSGGVERPALQQGQADDDAPTSRLLEPSTVEFAMPLTPWADQLLRADTDDACEIFVSFLLLATQIPGPFRCLRGLTRPQEETENIVVELTKDRYQ